MCFLAPVEEVPEDMNEDNEEILRLKKGAGKKGKAAKKKKQAKKSPRSDRSGTPDTGFTDDEEERQVELIMPEGAETDVAVEDVTVISPTENGKKKKINGLINNIIFFNYR